MDIFSYFMLFGGIGLFLFGMKYLGSSLERMAGSKLEKTLEKLTNNRLKGVLLGIFVTGAIQSSSATTIMLVGFVNAGIMSLAQTIPVLLGANIGTTITGQILRLADISGSGSTLLSLIKPSSFAPLLIGISAFIMLMSKKKKANNIAACLMGFGILFFGMTTMETALEPLSGSESFGRLFTTFSNPFVGLFLGLLLASILQSSSAAVGILQTIAAATGTVSFAVAAPMIIGISIGKITPIVLASIGIKREAQQVTLSQLIISVVGGFAGMAVLYLVLAPLGILSWDKLMTRGSIANLNTIYNIAISIIFVPFCVGVANLSKRILPDEAPSKMDESLMALNDMLLNTPTVALDQCTRVINNMGSTAVENYGLCIQMLDHYDEHTIEDINENEAFLDKAETKLSDYMVKVTGCNLQLEERKEATKIMHSIMDFERIGDHCVKLSDVAAYNISNDIVFTDNAKRELVLVADAVNEILTTTVTSFEQDDDSEALKVEPLEELISAMCESVKENHVARLQAGICTVQSGISLVECLTSFERIAAYCSNIALHVIEKHTSGSGFDMHGYAKEMHVSSEVYQDYYYEYSKKYMIPLEDLSNEQGID
ncbi:MAG: Na/Pi cotransporter family protein [Lachnospiraceae bacterium]|nr:Na/Pi cotransporter family protein [Lachnospiraceae bacterium]